MKSTHNQEIQRLLRELKRYAPPDWAPFLDAAATAMAKDLRSACGCRCRPVLSQAAEALKDVLREPSNSRFYWFAQHVIQEADRVIEETRE